MVPVFKFSLDSRGDEQCTNNKLVLSRDPSSLSEISDLRPDTCRDLPPVVRRLVYVRTINTAKLILTLSPSSLCPKTWVQP